MKQWVPGPVALGDREFMFDGDRVSVWEDGKLLLRDCGDDDRTCQCASCHRLIYMQITEVINFILCIFNYNKKTV